MHATDIEYLGYDVTALDEPSPRSRNLDDAERLVSTVAGAALAAYGLSRGSWTGLLVSALGGALIYRGATAHCPVYQKLGISTAVREGTQLTLERSITVLRPRRDVYRFWRSFENFPRFMRHLKYVQAHPDGTSDWAAKLPGGKVVEWRAAIIEEQEPDFIRWRSLEGSDIEHHGEVWFADAPGGRGTEVHVVWRYLPPGRSLGAIIAKLANVVNDSTLYEELRRFKQIIETGEIASTEGQTSGRKKRGRRASRLYLDPLDALEIEEPGPGEFIEEDVAGESERLEGAMP